MTIREARRLGTRSLAAAERPSPTPALDTDVLLQHILGCTKTDLLFKGERLLTASEQERLHDALGRRATGLPVAYITGQKEFYGRTFMVTGDVLIPKPDTETLVERTIRAARLLGGTGRQAGQAALAVCDTCTGSGCVGLSVLAECAGHGLHAPAPRRDMHLTLCDISPKALAVARQNCAALGQWAERCITFSCCDLLDDGTFDIISANPPYIPTEQARDLLADGRSEPLLALDGLSDDGLGIMRRLVPLARRHLSPGGMLLVEAGEYNAAQTQRLFEEAGFCGVAITSDLSGQPRVIEGTAPADSAGLS